MPVNRRLRRSSLSFSGMDYRIRAPTNSVRLHDIVFAATPIVFARRYSPRTSRWTSVRRIVMAYQFVPLHGCFCLLILSLGVWVRAVTMRVIARGVLNGSGAQGFVCPRHIAIFGAADYS
jgi:hypothetical protein